jgi:Fic family protein
MTYNWQQEDWPEFRYELDSLADQMRFFTDDAGRVSGLLEGLSEELGTEAVLDFMIAEAVGSSAIEGEILNREAVMSSIRNHLGLNPLPLRVDSRMADGAGELMVAVRTSFRDALTEDTLFAWHRMLLGSAFGLRIGGWREGGDPMQVVSGSIDRPTVHFEAPPAERIPDEMARFIGWFNDTAPRGPKAISHPPLRASLAHLYFESIHPFEDGNGRIGRALSEKALSQGLDRPVILSLSRSIDAKRKDYYEALKVAQRGNEVTDWVQWFVGVIGQAQRDACDQVRFVLRKSRFFQRYEPELNERQLKIVRRMFQSGAEGFIGGMNARKYVAITGVSKATATRDLQHLAQLGALTLLGGGRSTHYELSEC